MGGFFSVLHLMGNGFLIAYGLHGEERFVLLFETAFPGFE